MKHLTDSKGTVLGYLNPVSGLVIELICPSNPLRIKVSEALKFSFFTLIFEFNGKKYEISMKDIINKDVKENGDFIYYFE